MVEYKKVSDFQRGTLYNILEDAYSYDLMFKEYFADEWREADTFFYDRLDIADKYCIVTCLDNKAIGFVCWDPRNSPHYVEIGHNCILTKYKGRKFGKKQLIEAMRRIGHFQVKKIIVTTNDSLLPAQRNYEACGFSLVRRRENVTDTRFSGAYIDYEIMI